MAYPPPGATTDEHGRPLDQIRLVGIAATGHHGVFPSEREEGQPFVADVVAHLDTRRAAASDDLSLTLNYATLAEQVVQVLTGAPVNLVETVAEQIACVVLDHVGVAAVDVYVHKPQAPVAVAVDDVVVAIHRDRVKLPAARFEPPQDVAEAPAPAAAPVVAAPAAPAPSIVPPADEPGPPPALPRAEPAEVADDVPPVPLPDRMDVQPEAPVRAVLALGANLGDARATLRSAVSDLVDAPDVEVLAVAPLARTGAVGGPEQPDFLNTVVMVRTPLSPRQLLRLAQDIEAAHGRERTEQWGPRTLDIDIVVYDGLVAVADDLELPHPRAHERAFVLQPWAQIEPDAVLPGLGGGPVDALAATAPDRDGVRWLALDWLEDPPPAETDSRG